MSSEPPNLYIVQADVLRSERVLRAVERALARALDSQEAARAEYEVHEAKVRAESATGTGRLGFDERWAGSSGLHQLQADVELARKQLQAAKQRLTALLNGGHRGQLPRYGSGVRPRLVHAGCAQRRAPALTSAR